MLSAARLGAQDFLERITAYAGAGYTTPVGSPSDRVSGGYNFVAGAGPRFHPRIAVVLDFSLLDGLDIDIPRPNPQAPPIGDVRIWSLTVNPVFNFVKEEKVTAYATGGYGVYTRRFQPTTSGPFALPADCDEWIDICTPLSDDESVTKGGFNAGGGVAIGSREKFFGEVRYHRMVIAEATQVVAFTFGIRW